jgi:transcriptional regulator with XRE-family HTH domain
MQMPADASTAARMRLGVRLRTQRDAARITGEQAASVLGSSVTKVSRIEGARVAVRPEDIALLLDLYGISEPAERRELLDLAHEAMQPGWWDRFPGPLPVHVRHDLSLEAAAKTIAVFDGLAVPALLQTTSYARALCAMDPESAWRAALGPKALAHRREIMDMPGRPQLWALIGAGVLRRPPQGEASVLRRQIEHLIAAGQDADVTIQLVPEDAYAVSSAPGPFSLLRFAEPHLPDGVLLEHLTSTASVDIRAGPDRYRATDVDRYRAIFQMIASQAHTPEESRAVMLAESRRLPL